MVNYSFVLKSPNYSLPETGGSAFLLCLPQLLAAILILSFFLCSPALGKTAEDFPVYQSMTPNVRFWEDVYSRYTTRQGILHDQDNLAIVYTVVNLVDWETRGAARINRKLIRAARHHYKSILANLAEGKAPVTNDEKRVASLFPPHSKRAFKEARDRIRLQIGQKDRFEEGFIRSGKYLPTIKKIFRSYKLPEELSYLPHVESSFNPDAHSKAGAAGLWQFTRSTGRQYMRVDHIIDHRYDPYYSSRAAAVFLKENFEALGSWPLAITAYNHGRNGMVRAVNKYKSYEKIFQNHETRMFRFASRNFYSEFIAAMNVARRLEKATTVIPDRPEASFLVHMEGFASAADILFHFRISEKDLVRLNPALRKPVLTGEKFIPKNYYVRIPANDRTRNLATTIPSRIYHSSQVRDKEYIVQRGDTAGAIARRYKISLNDLIMANSLNKKAMIRIGQRLKIPTKNTTKQTEKIVTLKPSSKTRPD